MDGNNGRGILINTNKGKKVKNSKEREMAEKNNNGEHGIL